MDKVSQIKIIKLELLRLRTIIYELTNSSYKDLTPEEISTYIDNLNRSITLTSQINKSFSTSKKRADTALKTAIYNSEKNQFAADPDFKNLQEDLDKLYKMALENKSQRSNDENKS
jgi:hypothetical protein